MRPKKAYYDQKNHAQKRGIEFLISYEDWLEMWLESGMWEKRGKTKNSFQMCRYGDEGAYTKNNCFIGTVEHNQNDRSFHEDEKVLNIINAYLNSNKTQYEVGEEFGVDQSYVSRVVNKKRRAYVQNNSASY